MVGGPHGAAPIFGVEKPKPSAAARVGLATGVIDVDACYRVDKEVHITCYVGAKLELAATVPGAINFRAVAEEVVFLVLEAVALTSLPSEGMTLACDDGAQNLCHDNYLSSTSLSV